MTKDSVRAVLGPVPVGAGRGTIEQSGLLEWVSVCESFVSLKLNDPGVAEREPLAGRIGAAVSAHARAAGVGLQSLIVEYVDSAGSVVHTSRFGAGVPAGVPTGVPAGGATEGHRPIGGLGQAPAPTGSQTGSQSGASRAQHPQDTASGLPGVRNVIAVGAGKGGVGKSTIAVNLAVALARRGHAVGILDGDIYGPSLPTLLGLGAMEQVVMQGMLQPFLVHGVKAITLGKLVDAEKPLIWRGPMAHGAFKQLTEQTSWGELDYLVIDLPPGTGDVSLTLAQTLRLSGAVVVCTPQKVAQDDAVRAARMFQQLGIDVLGVVENMSWFIGDDGKEYDIFGRGGAQVMAQRLGLPFLGAVPLNMALRANSDRGEPLKNFDAGVVGSALSGALEAVATRAEQEIAIAEMRRGTRVPTLTVS
ncbi:MAG: Mrp/NBP35 family ATP-binding protein [Phycisphaeraceae bacterium]|nr:Mrp/NBP35 family ATP-binding protein [Phycisphaeraceae bacterium]